MIAAIINGTEEILEELRGGGGGGYGISIYSTGGETADVGDLVRTIIVDSTVTCRMKRSEVISNHRIQAGNVVVGLASSVRRPTKRNITAVWVATALPQPVTMCSINP